MKTLRIALLVLIVLPYPGVSQRVSITFSFTVTDSLTGNPLAADSLKVLNLTEGCDTMLYNPISSLNLDASWPYGLEELTSEKNLPFSVMPNVPNPFKEITRVSVNIRNDLELRMDLLDLRGSLLAKSTNHLSAGWNEFDIKTGIAGVFLLKISSGEATTAIRLVCTGGKDAVYTITGPFKEAKPIEKQTVNRSGFLFFLGNQLKFTAYADNHLSRSVVDNPMSSKTYSISLLPMPICGESFTVYHIAGDVAPVNKTVTYGTVTGIPGEPNKCWITSNLGASHEAISVDDTTEASAGWHWQFNHKQGYKHDGTTRTPNTTWITYYDDNSNWLMANDPCNLELGTGWRLPTISEWRNIRNLSDWHDWTYGWECGLKMHAAGHLTSENCSLKQRGVIGSYWSSTLFEYNTYQGYFLSFNYLSCNLFATDMATGFSVRCLRDN